MITIEGTVIDILGYPATPFTVVAKMPATKAPAKAATAGGKDARSISSNRNVLDTAPITPAAAASLIGLLKRMENPNTPPMLASRRNMIHCHSANLSGRNGIGFNPRTIAKIHAVMVATVIIISEYIRRSIPERISNFAKSIPLVINGNPGIINNIEQIYPASC